MKIIYAIPGLGTTKGLFDQVSIPGHRLQVLDWPLPRAGQSLRDYAAEFRGQIGNPGPVHLLGVSFGGMLCAELCEQIETASVVLISSCKNRRQLPRSIRLLKYLPIHRLVGERFHRFMASHSRYFVGIPKSYMNIFRAMIAAMPPNYFTYCTDMIVNWDRMQNSRPIPQLHGNADRLLTCRSGRDYTVIQGGTHGMIVDRATELSSLLDNIYNHGRS